MNSRLKVLRGILTEIRRSVQKPVGNQLFVKNLLNYYRSHQVTGLTLCKGPRELESLAELYLCHLQSSRRFAELLEKYRSKEATTVQAANRVGLQLPKTYVD